MSTVDLSHEKLCNVIIWNIYYQIYKHLIIQKIILEL